MLTNCGHWRSVDLGDHRADPARGRGGYWGRTGPRAVLQRASDDDLTRHYREVADAVDVPVLLYNFPTAFGFNIEPDVVVELADHSNVIGIKDSLDDLRQMYELTQRTRNIGFDIMSGWDSLARPIINAGATGVFGGGGRVGRHVAEQLSDDRNTVTVVELDSKNCERISPKVSYVVHGDGSDPDTLERINLVETDIFAALTDDTEVNLTACKSVHDQAPEVRTILRISRDGEQDYGHRRFVDGIIYPAAAGADAAVDRITTM